MCISTVFICDGNRLFVCDGLEDVSISAITTLTGMIISEKLI